MGLWGTLFQTIPDTVAASQSESLLRPRGTAARVNCGSHDATSCADCVEGRTFLELPLE